MNRWTPVIVLIFALWASACAPVRRRGGTPFVGERPLNTHVDLAGRFMFSSAGALTLVLDVSCRRTYPGAWCDQETLDAIVVTAVTPWGHRVRGSWASARRLVFRVDWALSGLDPLEDNVEELVTRPWTISTTSWTPTRDDARRILKLIGDATGTEPDLVRGGLAPELQVTALELAEGELRAGGEVTLRVRIVNRGSGTAYRVSATTRSSIASLHDQRMRFGMIKPGATKTRTLRIMVPPSETAEDTMLVVTLAEGNGFTPGNVSRRFAIKPSATQPVLDLQCALVGRGGRRPELDAGEQVVLRCTVNNAGTAVAAVSLETAIADDPPRRSFNQDIAVRGSAVFDIPLVVPLHLAIDSDVEFVVIARDAVFLRTAQSIVVGVVRKPRLCTAGQLTLEQYRAKILELRAAVGAGDLTSAQLDRYDAELVACLP
jgi:hypothetical protein